MEAGQDAVVLEGPNRVGGRVVNREIGEGQVVEGSGAWVSSRQKRILELANELGLETFPTYNWGRHLATR